MLELDTVDFTNLGDIGDDDLNQIAYLLDISVIHIDKQISLARIVEEETGVFDKRWYHMAKCSSEIKKAQKKSINKEIDIRKKIASVRQAERINKMFITIAKKELPKDIFSEIFNQSKQA